MNSLFPTVGICGTGAMGQGIAQMAAQAGSQVLLFDAATERAVQAQQAIAAQWQKMLDKQRITAAQHQSYLSALKTVDSLQALSGCDLVVEAIVENAQVKQALFAQLCDVLSGDAVLASNTSSLSITALAAGLKHPERFAGLHFFNPAQIMKLVEVVKAEKTSDDVISSLMQLCLSLKKTPVLCIDAPGFIVNRVARHYYLEAMKLVELNLATMDTVDEIMEATGFKMGPFKLMDLIGNDINLAVTTSLYEAFNHELRFEPSTLQINKVKNNELGRKTGKGFYDYAK